MRAPRRPFEQGGPRLKMLAPVSALPARAHSTPGIPIGIWPCPAPKGRIMRGRGHATRDRKRREPALPGLRLQARFDPKTNFPTRVFFGRFLKTAIFLANSRCSADSECLPSKNCRFLLPLGKLVFPLF